MDLSNAYKMEKVYKVSFWAIFLYMNLFASSFLFSIEITFSFVGDVMFHMPTVNSAYSNGKYHFENIFEHIKKYIEKSDIAFCNLETTLGGQPHTGYPRFSSPDEVLDALKYAGFDIINVANNHMLDRGVLGLKRTLEQIKKHELIYVGARSTPLEELYKIIEVKGLRISFVSFTYSTNGIPIDEKYKYMFMYISKQTLLSILNEMKKISDVLIVYFHYGNEYETTPTKEQIELAYLALDNGADMVIASHPHVLQHIELVEYGPKTKLIAYSLGNFLSNMKAPGTDEGVILNVTYHPIKGVVDVTPILTWVHCYKLAGKSYYRILPAADFTLYPDELLTKTDTKRLAQIAQKKLSEQKVKRPLISKTSSNLNTSLKNYFYKQLMNSLILLH
ncbi:Bacterial capsule synthesis protein PGA_cap [Fervidobacterium pennivorans DSM 9078]|jgi:poly-gamma-glutamate synthesis protein (capsule biosynthesis protein)|uniref:Bacterial capsule synthesis protein PGA_cap n=1 Tax=Fervidobacterium pennivorans (strain DSM 9078 / Ven5) TaxID=771875 RepID=H9UCK3_FERPD|nr:CapA family protein [Fervidobacterium pennivorans]AFG35246.1 Bacterial capsule synthesis protein PGA_cap [Fervidobacterium pennivorans DSM 9078]QIV78391.1 CapA family protein [Fervidobacterium pennivorans subsp. keratinolyticus]